MYKAMLVDDEPLILQGLKDLISWENLDIEIVAVASCGIDALDILLSQDIHILITDIKMSYMDGLELIKQIRYRNLQTKIIVLSGYDDFSYIKEAVKFGIENYLLKPVSEIELISTLNTIIDKLKTNLYHNDILKNNFLIRWVHHHIEHDELIDKQIF
jgi:two-component system, response regulator YesN